MICVLFWMCVILQYEKFKNIKNKIYSLFALADVPFYRWKYCLGWLSNMLETSPADPDLWHHFKQLESSFCYFRLSFTSRKSKGATLHLTKFMARRNRWFKYSGLLSCLSLKLSHDICVSTDIADRANYHFPSPFGKLRYYFVQIELQVLIWPSNRASLKCLAICRF